MRSQRVVLFQVGCEYEMLKVNMEENGMRFHCFPKERIKYIETAKK